MAGVSYATVPDFKAWVGLSDTIDDVVIGRALLAASRGIDNFTHTWFGPGTAATNRLFDTCDSHRLRIGDWAAVTAVASDDDADGTFETVWAATDFQLLPLDAVTLPEPEPFTEIHAIGTLTFPRAASATTRHGLIRVTGTPGWPAIPDAVVEAALLVANRLVKRRGSPEGVVGFDEFGVIRISARDDPDAVRYLTPYKTSRRRGGWALA